MSCRAFLLDGRDGNVQCAMCDCSVQCDHKQKVTTAFISQMFGQETFIRFAVQCAMQCSALKSSSLSAKFYEYNYYFYCYFSARLFKATRIFLFCGREKFRIQHTLDLLTCADSSTDTKNIRNKSSVTCHV